MAKFFEIPAKDKIKGHNEALDLIENYLKDPEKQSKADAFGLDEPTAVFQKAADTAENHTHLNDESASHSLNPLLKKLFIALAAIVASIISAWLLANLN
jgi:hypothetical protein